MKIIEILKQYKDFIWIQHLRWQLILKRQKKNLKAGSFYLEVDMHDPIICAAYNIDEDDTIEIHLKPVTIEEICEENNITEDFEKVKKN